MTNEEAIKVLRKMYLKADLVDAYGDYEDAEPYSKAMDLAIEALTKQTPTPPNWQGDEACVDAYCPYCGEWLDDGDVLCEKCHQIIDWSDSK